MYQWCTTEDNDVLWTHLEDVGVSRLESLGDRLKSHFFLLRRGEECEAEEVTGSESRSGALL